MENLNKKHGNRTLHRLFDDVNNYHTSTIAHHDLSTIEHQSHFDRGIKRLTSIRDNNVPILFVNISHFTEFDNTIDINNNNNRLYNSIINYGFSDNIRIISIYLMEYLSNIDDICYTYNNHIVYKLKSHGYNSVSDDTQILEILLKHYNMSNLYNIDTMDSL
jgi:hypothetical protein